MIIKIGKFQFRLGKKKTKQIVKENENKKFHDEAMLSLLTDGVLYPEKYFSSLDNYRPFVLPKTVSTASTTSTTSTTSTNTNGVKEVENVINVTTPTKENICEKEKPCPVCGCVDRCIHKALYESRPDLYPLNISK